jgi:hypothetical protein
VGVHHRLLLGLATIAQLGAAHADNAAPTCDPGRTHCLSIRAHVAGVSTDWIASQLATANRYFAALDVGFEIAGVDALPASANRIPDRAARDALATRRARPPAIDVFFVERLDDIGRADAPCGGVPWRAPHDGRKYLIVSARGLDRALAHELGHFSACPTRATRSAS